MNDFNYNQGKLLLNVYALKCLHTSKKWMRILGILGFVSAVFILFIVFVVMPEINKGSEPGTEHPVFVGLIMFSVLLIILSVYLFYYAGTITKVISSRKAIDAEKLMLAQYNFWNLIAVIMVVNLLISIMCAIL